MAQRIMVGDQTNVINPNFRVFVGVDNTDPENEIVNDGTYSFQRGGTKYLTILFPNEYSLHPNQDNVLADHYRNTPSYLFSKSKKTTAPAPEPYTSEYNMVTTSIGATQYWEQPEDADFHIQIVLTPVPPVVGSEPEPEPVDPDPVDPEPKPKPTISFTYKEGKGLYNKFRNMTTQYTNGETVTVDGEYSTDVPITFTAESGYYLNNIVIDVDGKENSIFVGSQNITTTELIAKNVKPNSVVSVWGYGLAIPNDTYVYSENLVNATSSMTGESEIVAGEHTITFYANEGFVFDSVGAYNMNGKSYDFYASGKEYSLTVDVQFDLAVDLVAVPISDSISPFVNIYEVTKQELGELSLERFSDEYLDLQTGVTSSGVDYGDMIVNLIRIPYDIPDYVERTREPIKLGKFVTTTMSNLLNTNHIEIKLGSVKVEGEKGNVSDYKNVRAFLYVPYADRMELPIEYVMDNKVEVTLEIDLFSGNGVITVTSQDVPVYKNMVVMSETIPFVQLRDTTYSNKVNALLYGTVKPFISLEKQEVVEQVALPTQKDVTLNSLTGYVEVDRILSIDTKASVNEQTEILGLLKQGVEIK